MNPTRDLSVFIHGVGWRDLVDVLLVALLLYQLLKLIRGTQAVQLLVGLGVLFAVAFAAQTFHLRLLEWVFANGSQSILIAAIVLFQPELRRALDQVGRLTLVRTVLGQYRGEDIAATVDEVLRAVRSLSESRTGALVVFERETGLENVAATGIRINGTVTGELLASLFFPRSPLHDGAVIIREHILVAAGCGLPLAESTPGAGRMGTRHRAALGLTLQSDSVVLIVSEESGRVGLANEGRLTRGLDPFALREQLILLLGGHPTGSRVSIRPLARAGGTVRALTRR